MEKRIILERGFCELGWLWLATFLGDPEMGPCPIPTSYGGGVPAGKVREVIARLNPGFAIIVVEGKE